MKVLVACEFSGVVRDAFLVRGHDAWSCDLLPSDSGYFHGGRKHYQCDVRDVVQQGGWDLMIAHPPCTYLCNSGVRWLKDNQARFDNLIVAAGLFNALLEAHIPKIAIENPIQHKYARSMIIRPYTQIVQPYYFGEPETKATCLWLKNVPKLQPSNLVMPMFQTVHREPPGPERWKNRSRTFQGIADAMAEQWG